MTSSLPETEQGPTAPRLSPVRSAPSGVDDASVLEVLLEASADGFALLDRDARYLLVSRSLARASGRPAAEHVGRRARDLGPEGLPEVVEQHVAEVVSTGEPCLGRAMTGDGALQWRTDWHPVRTDGSDEVVAVALVATDVSRDVSLRATALTLQRSLLPQDVPSTEELEVAVRYVAGAADTEVGGDWYDVIALGAGRLALVIGDVMGRGVPAAAVMGQLRTAVRTCARLDLAPVEVLDVLDGLVADLGEAQIATCAYGVFDPHTRELLLASAGHLPPVLRTAGGGVELLRVDASAPLGVGDAPRQTAVRLPPGSVLALYTDGLVERRGTDIDARLAELGRALAEGGDDLELLADGLMSRMTDSDSDDDVALLLVRVPEDVDARSRTVLVRVPRERALLVDVRARARTAMRSWALLDEVVATATLLACELVTNALLHGLGQVELRLRLTRDRLVLEAVDEGRLMPRRRRAAHDDEGGRGLQLVATLADRWGSRTTETGKVVWAELDLAGPYA
ncbi:MAG: putative sensor protein [Frankiales bacterium]|nr:putative sensor protein [Frankiales bacterium]